ncbi:MAG: haloacid dehalogenase-like hydrolase, partial [Enhydrobacter sp.]
MIRTRTLLSVLLGASLSWAAPAFAQSDPLSSWGDTPAKASIVALVEKVTRAGSPDFVPVAERIATF